VTGASSGIGQACAVAMAEAGTSVVCDARNADRLNKTVDAILSKGLEAQALILDQADLGALKDVIQQPFDIVINSAGMVRHKMALETLPEDFDVVMAVNLRSAYFLSTYSAQLMKKAKINGSIIHISSQRGPRWRH
jgi:NAD(P)-dependent dehydrogenase (short-subunit alcohol dehydrogenase family)